MDAKKKYNAPTIKTEKVEIGVFGQYGSSNGNYPRPTSHFPGHHFGRRPRRRTW